jgi:hypothetical protein
MHQLVYNYKNNIDLSPCQLNKGWEIEIYTDTMGSEHAPIGVQL